MNCWGIHLWIFHLVTCYQCHYHHSCFQAFHAIDFHSGFEGGLKGHFCWSLRKSMNCLTLISRCYFSNWYFVGFQVLIDLDEILILVNRDDFKFNLLILFSSGLKKPFFYSPGIHIPPPPTLTYNLLFPLSNIYQWKVLSNHVVHCLKQ